MPDVPKKELKLELSATGLRFEGKSDTMKKTYRVALDFYAEIDDDASKINHTARDIEIKLIKKELNDEYWPRLLKDSKKQHFLKTDFDKWVDEDEQNEAAEEDFSNFGGMGRFFSMSFLPLLLLMLSPFSTCPPLPLYVRKAKMHDFLQVACRAWAVRDPARPRVWLPLRHLPPESSVCLDLSSNNRLRRL